MVRVPPERGGGTRLEVRVGDGAANPYLVIAGVLAAALDGITRKLPCPDDAVGMAYDNEDAPILPATFTEALDALEANANLHDQLAPELVGVFLAMKRDEIARYQQVHSASDDRIVTQWELDEYIEEF
jgi:glutamine synthetase